MRDKSCLSKVLHISIMFTNLTVLTITQRNIIEMVLWLLQIKLIMFFCSLTRGGGCHTQ